MGKGGSFSQTTHDERIETSQEQAKTDRASCRAGQWKRAPKVLDYSRNTLYRWKKAPVEGGEDALKELTRRRPNLRNRVSEDTETAVFGMAYEQRACGQVRCRDGAPCQRNAYEAFGFDRTCKL